jgi:hypothetical protein
VFALLLTERTPGLTGPGLASFSPFVGVMLATAQMHAAKFAVSEWNQVLVWVAVWTVADVALVAVLLKAVLVTFNRCLGRVDAAHAPRVAPPRPLEAPPVAEGMSECG